MGEIPGDGLVSCGMIDAEGCGKTILLVDDDAISREKISAILGRQGYAVIERSEAESALALVRGMTPVVDLVIMDGSMPNMDGFEFAAELKHIMPGVPLIMITAHSDIESYLKAINIGIFEYMSKPFIARELVRVVNLVLKQRKQVGFPAEVPGRARDFQEEGLSAAHRRERGAVYLPSDVQGTDQG